MAFGNFDDLDPGDETRTHGDYVGFPHSESDGTAIGSIAGPTEGQPVAYDEATDALVEAADTDDVAGVLYTYPYYGDSSNAGPYVDGSKNATVKTSGTVVVDFSGISVNASPGVDGTDEGTSFGANGELYIVNVFDAANNLAEVLVR